MASALRTGSSQWLLRSCIACLLLTDFSLGILKLRLKQAQLLELDLKLLGSLLMLGVIVDHFALAVCN